MKQNIIDLEMFDWEDESDKTEEISEEVKKFTMEELKNYDQGTEQS